MYTQYKPFVSTTNSTLTSLNDSQQLYSSQLYANAPLATISSSSSSSVLLSANNSSDTATMPPGNTNGPSYFTQNRRECLFYHSTDNYPNRISHQQRMILKEQQKKFIEQQQKLGGGHKEHEDLHIEVPPTLQENDEKSRNVSKNSCIYSYSLINRPRIEDLYSNRDMKLRQQQQQQQKQQQKQGVVMHSMPFNSGNQIHVVQDLFKLDEDHFDRTHINQLSTKSQPSMHTNARSNNEIMMFMPNSSPSGTTSSSASTSSASTPPLDTSQPIHNFQHHQHQNQYRNLILPHPAQV
jgi:hypothetical protein